MGTDGGDDHDGGHVHDHGCDHGRDCARLRDDGGDGVLAKPENRGCGPASMEDHVFCKILHPGRMHHNHHCTGNFPTLRQCLPRDGDGFPAPAQLDLQIPKPARDICTFGNSSGFDRLQFRSPDLRRWTVRGRDR